MPVILNNTSCLLCFFTELEDEEFKSITEIVNPEEDFAAYAGLCFMDLTTLRKQGSRVYRIGFPIISNPMNSFSHITIQKNINQNTKISEKNLRLKTTLSHQQW